MRESGDFIVVDDGGKVDHLEAFCAEADVANGKVGFLVSFKKFKQVFKLLPLNYLVKNLSYDAVPCSIIQLHAPALASVHKGASKMKLFL